MGDLWLWFPHAEPLGKCLLVRSALHASLKHTQQALQVRPRVTNTPGISVWPWPAASSRLPFLTLTPQYTATHTHTRPHTHTHNLQLILVVSRPFLARTCDQPCL